MLYPLSIYLQLEEMYAFKEILKIQKPLCLLKRDKLKFRPTKLTKIKAYKRRTKKSEQ